MGAALADRVIEAVREAKDLYEGYDPSKVAPF